MSTATNHQKYNRVYAPILLSITLILGMFMLKPAYTEYLAKQTQLATIEKQKAEKKLLLESLTAVQKSFSESGSSEMIEKVRKLDQKFDVSNIMSVVMLNDYTRPNAISKPKISIASISVDKGSKMPSGLSLGTVSLSLSSLSVDDMIDFITYLTQSSGYVFTIDSIALPIDTLNTTPLASGVSLNI